MFKRVPSKKERAFYVQSVMVGIYCVARFFNGSLSTFDGSFTLLMTLLASYHISQAGVDMMSASKGKKETGSVDNNQ